MPVLSNSECNNMFKLAALDEHVSEEIWVCAGYRDGGKDACDVSVQCQVCPASIKCQVLIKCQGSSLWFPSVQYQV